MNEVLMWFLFGAMIIMFVLNMVGIVCDILD